MLVGFLWGKSQGKRLLGRHRLRGEDNIKMNLQVMGRGAWTGLMTQNRDR